MLGGTILLALVALAISPGAAATAEGTTSKVPSLKVPRCPGKGTVTYSKSVPAGGEFPTTQVDLCYDATAIRVTFTAYNETSFFYNASQGTNDDIWQYEVMEAFIFAGTTDPRTYLEFEVNPNNVTFQAFIYNPSKVRAAGAPFDGAFWRAPLAVGITAETRLDRAGGVWVSSVRIPLALFNVDDGQAQGTEWRMNFFRTVASPQSFPNQELGAWSPPSEANFHMTPFFGRVKFV